MPIDEGTRLGRYEIRSKIGEGGMGEVYLAQDTKLDRKVALKILPADLAANQDRMRRFVQEAKAAAALNHPNIAHIYEIGESEGVNFIAMEYVEGATLRKKIHREQTELRKLLRYLQQVAEGLAKAHAAGIIHRDLKPDNVMITRDGYAKILDFGLAKLTEHTKPQNFEPSEEEAPTAILRQALSTPGMVMGTVGYMSPEQAQAKPVDHRSDIFSFGCLLYEAATGQRAFESESTIDTLHKIVHATVPLVKDANPSAPADLTRIVRRCLAKDPDDRYQSIREAAIELRELRRDLEGAAELETTVPPSSVGSTVSATPSGATAASGASLSTEPASSAEYIVTGIKRHKIAAVVVLAAFVLGGVGLAAYLHARNTEVAIDSIAVLPFQNRSGNTDADYLSDGLAESLVFRLSQLPNLRVSPMSSVIRYKGKDTDVSKAASELGVDAVMSGWMVQRGDELILSVELVDARSNKVLWGEQYDRKMADLLVTQREIATTIAQKLELKLAGSDATGITKKYTNSNEAYQLYMKARYHAAKRTKASMLQAVDYYRQAIALDPNFALAYARMAEVYLNLPAYPYTSPSEAIPEAKKAAEKALELDPNLSEAHTFVGFYLVVFAWNWTDAEREFTRAIELDPNSAEAHFRYGQLYLGPVGRYQEAVREFERSLELEPLNINAGNNFAAVYMYAGQNELAVAQARKTYDLEPGYPLAPFYLGLAYNGAARYDDAITLSEKVLQGDPTNQMMLRVAGCAYAMSGRRVEAEGVVKKYREIGKTNYVASYWVANIYAVLGDKEKAFAELEKAFKNREWEMHRLKADPLMAPLRDDPRYAAMLKRLNFSE